MSAHVRGGRNYCAESFGRVLWNKPVCGKSIDKKCSGSFSVLLPVFVSIAKNYKELHAGLQQEETLCLNVPRVTGASNRLIYRCAVEKVRRTENLLAVPQTLQCSFKFSALNCLTQVCEITSEANLQG